MYINITLALDTTQFLSSETEYMPWQAALNNLQYLELMFDRSEVFGVMTVSGATAAGPAARQSPVPGERGQGGCCWCHGTDCPPAPRNTYSNR